MAVEQSVEGTGIGTWSVVDYLGNVLGTYGLLEWAQAAEQALLQGAGGSVDKPSVYPFKIPGTSAWITYGTYYDTPGGDRFEVEPGIWISPDQLNPVTTTGDADPGVGVDVGAGVGVGAAQTAAQAAMEAAGIPWDVSYPEQQFRQYAGQQFQPGLNLLRKAFYGMQEPLMQQYYLGAPQMEQPFGGFGQFMAQRGGVPAADAAPWNPYGYTMPIPPTAGMGEMGRAETPSLFGMAQRASAAAGLTPGQFLEYIDPQAGYAGPAIGEKTKGFLGDITPEQQLWYRRVYGTSDESEKNRAALVNLMALQRSPVGGAAQPMYGGALGEAITGSLGELYTQLMARDPGANFLDWYMQRTAGQPGIGGFLSGTAKASPAVSSSGGFKGPFFGGPYPDISPGAKL